jgi:sortase A
MTMVDAGPERDGSAWHSGGPAVVPPGRARRPGGSQHLVREAGAATLWILSLCLLGFAVWFPILSRLHYDRTQVTAYAVFRNELALATAPTGPTLPPSPTQPNAPTQLLPLGTPVAVLSIPEIGLTTVVFEGTSGQVLEGGPGHLRYTPLPGQPGVSVIFGRRTAYGGPFSRLPSIHVGDDFSVTTGQGVATYRIIDRRRGGDPAPLPPTADQGRLILVTADGPPLAPTGVVYVDADQTSKVVPAPTMILSQFSIGADERTLGSDPNALVPVVLWGAGLLAVAAGLAWAVQRWGRWQSWIVAVPVVGFLSLTIADQVARLLPNLL